MIDCRYGAIAAAAFALAGCGPASPVAEQANEGVPPPATALANNDAAAEIRNEAIRPAESSGGAIPAFLHGRWGLTPQACDAPLSKAEGVLVVTADELLFYESRAEPAGGIETSSNSMSAEFSFTADDRTWTRHQTLQLRDNRLIRSERDPAGSFSYVRC